MGKLVRNGIMRPLNLDKTLKPQSNQLVQISGLRSLLSIKVGKYRSRGQISLASIKQCSPSKCVLKLLSKKSRLI